MKRCAATAAPVLGVLVVGTVLSGCGGWDEGRALGLDLRSRTIFTGSDGLARVRVPLGPNDGKFLMASRVTDGDQTVYVDRVEDSGGNIRRFLEDLDVFEMRTGAVADQELNHLNWPIGADDPDLAGEEVSVYVGAVNADRSLRVGAEVQVDVLLSDDTGFDEGELRVNIHFADGVGSDAEYRDAIEQAVTYMADEIYANVGVTVAVVDYLDWEGGTLPRPGFGAPDDWLAITNSTDSSLALDLVIVDTIAGSDATILGAAGSIPGGLLGSEKSGMILSASANAGPDLVYSESEIDLLGSTMAHELGHMLGLFHPVERSYERWDALSDTERCESESACQGALGTNLMYPTALCTSTTCLSQTDLTEDQTGVLQRYTGVY